MKGEAHGSSGQAGDAWMGEGDRCRDLWVCGNAHAGVGCSVLVFVAEGVRVRAALARCGCLPPFLLLHHPSASC